MPIFSFFDSRRNRRFDSRVRPHLPALYRYAYRLCGSRDDAEDLVQDLLIRLYEKRAIPETLDNPQAWLLKVLYRQFIDWQRKSHRTPTRLSDDNSDEIIAALHQAQDGPDHALERKRLQRDLELAVESLNEEQRIVLLLHDVEGFTLPELHKALNTPVGTLKSRLHRGRSQLRKLFFSAMEPSESTERVHE